METLQELILDPLLYWQIFAIITCSTLAFITFKLSQKKIITWISASSSFKKIELVDFFIKSYILPLIYPLFLIIFLTIGLSIYGKFFSSDQIFLTIIKVISLLMFIKFLRVVSQSNLITNTAASVLIPCFILESFGLLSATIERLDEYAIVLGEVRLSIYIILKALVVLIAVLWISNLVSKKGKKYISSRRDLHLSTKNIMSKMIDIIIYLFVFLVVLKTFGVDLTALAVIGGAVGVGIGFGLQKIASNFISGIILLLEKSIEVGDIIEIDNGSVLGTVKYFGGRYTQIECFDGKEVMVPNEDFIVGKVTNWTYSDDKGRIRIDIGVAYGSDLLKVQQIMISCALEHPRCLKDPEVGCYLTSFGDSDIKFSLYFWVANVNEGLFGPKSDVYMTIWKKFQENKIEIPFPQREVKILNQK